MKNSKQLNCKLIVSDFDGTLANSKNEVSKENINAINEYVLNGGIFAVCTGRILPSIMPVARGMGLKGLIVACQGCVIADIESGEIIRNIKFTSEQSARICAELEALDTNVQAYPGDGFFSNLPAENEGLQLYEKITGIKAKHADMPLSSYILQHNIGCQKIATLCTPEDQAELYSKLKAIFKGEFEVTCSANVLIEIVPVGENKGTALNFLADHYNVPRGLTCAVGDNLNDLSMIKAAGYGVAVGNASPALKEKAEYITVTNDNNAVAQVINDYGYTK